MLIYFFCFSQYTVDWTSQICLVKYKRHYSIYTLNGKIVPYYIPLWNILEVIFFNSATKILSGNIRSMKFSSINLYFAAIPKSLCKKKPRCHWSSINFSSWRKRPLYLTQYFLNPVSLSPVFNFQFTGLVISGKRFNKDWTVEHSNCISPEGLLSWLPWGTIRSLQLWVRPGKKKPHCRQHSSHWVPVLQ